MIFFVRFYRLIKRFFWYVYMKILLTLTLQINIIYSTKENKHQILVQMDIKGKYLISNFCVWLSLCNDRIYMNFETLVTNIVDTGIQYFLSHTENRFLWGYGDKGVRVKFYSFIVNQLTRQTLYTLVVLEDEGRRVKFLGCMYF